MVGLFTGPCLAKFPDDAAVESYAASEKLTPMTEEQVRQLLGTDPGMGWIRQTDSGTYRLTIEKPPYHACALRKTFDKAPKALKSYYFLMLSLWAAGSKPGDLTEQPAQSAEVGSLPTRVYLYLLTAPDGKAKEQFIALITDLPDGAHEVRLVRQILAN